MNHALDTLCYLQEQTSFAEDYADKFGYEVHDMGSRFYVTFPAVLQSFNDGLNRNGRCYDQQNIWYCIANDDYVQSMLKQNSWVGEIDHPAPEILGKELTIQRISNPDLKKSSHFIRSPRMVGNNLEANIQTDSSNENGMNMAIKIVDGKIVPCFSARVFGTKAPNSNKVIVRKLVTYDWVLYPSHRTAQAKIHQPIMESVQECEQITGAKIIFFPEIAKMAAGNEDEVKFLCERFELSEEDIIGITATGNSVVLAEGANVYIQPITSEQVRNKTKSALKDWMNS